VIAKRAAQISIEELAPLSVAAMDQPSPLRHSFRDKCPVSHSNVHGGFWTFFRDKDVCAAAVDPTTFSSNDVTIPRSVYELDTHGAFHPAAGTTIQQNEAWSSMVIDAIQRYLNRAIPTAPR
jgi:hypothetical protein